MAKRNPNGKSRVLHPTLSAIVGDVIRWTLRCFRLALLPAVAFVACRSEPGAVTRLVEPQTCSAKDSCVYDVAVAAGPEALLVTWTEHHLREGDATASPDIFYHLAQSYDHGAEAGSQFTPYAESQLLSRPFYSELGLGVGWGDDAVASFPDRRILWRFLADGPVSATQDAHVTTQHQSHQRSATDIAVCGDRAMVVYASTADEQRWHGSILDLNSGTIVREIDLGSGSWQAAYSVTAGSSTFLVLHAEGEPDQTHQVIATLFDEDGEHLLESLITGEVPPQNPQPVVHAGFHDGRYLIPFYDYEVVEVDRPCCPLCNMVQPPTCIINDYHLYVRWLAEDNHELTEPACLDCRTDVGIAWPMIASATDGVYMYWQGFVARVTVDEIPAEEKWRAIEYPSPEPYTAISREIHDFVIRDEEVVLVGRQRGLGADNSCFQAFIAGFIY